MTRVSTTNLTSSGFTEAQATPITRTVQATTHDVVEILRDDLARWHVYLALSLLIQIGIVLLAILLTQAIHEPSRAAQAGPTSGQTMKIW